MIPALPAGWIAGVDVSRAGQPSALPWPTLARWGVRWCYVRLAHGLTLDTAAARHVAGARAAGLLVGGYGVLSTLGERDAGDQGGALASRAEELAAPGETALDLPLALDLELPTLPRAAALSPRDACRLLASAACYVEAVEAVSERGAMIYTYPAWWATVLSRAGADGRALAERVVGRYLAGDTFTRPLWLARYGAPLDPGHWPAAPAPWTEVALWQAAGGAGTSRWRATLPGGGAVDLDVWRETVDELRALGR